MKYLTEKEFEKEMTQIKQQKRQYEMKKELREAKRRFPKFKKPRTSKMVLWTVIAIYMKNSRVEHQMGQFENQIETPSVTLDLNNKEENKAAG